jgi:2-succinyl-5-enolpyruvyl-6-hydroxy-3-cyclohexene-1-carboxylate synthase
MNFYYSVERNVQIVIAILKANNIRKVIASPGVTNIPFVGSIQNDPFFEVYSCVDERSAAYMACGLSEESGEPVVISCTGATASRNYMPGLTEAYYRKIPVIALTSSRPVSKIGHLHPQVTDRTCPPSDVAIKSFVLNAVKNEEDEWDCMIKVNKAISLLTREGGGPVHLNLVSSYSEDFTVKEIKPVRVIKRITTKDEFPPLPKGKIAVFIGSHKKWTKEGTDSLDRFCEAHNAIVLYDHTSNYTGKYGIACSVTSMQKSEKRLEYAPDLCIHIGEVSGGWLNFLKRSKVWRVSCDGKFKDFSTKLRFVFDMSEQEFFEAYSNSNEKRTDYYETCKKQEEQLREMALKADIPFSNIWMAMQLAPKLPHHSVLHLGIFNSLRAWNFFEIDSSIRVYSNVGGFGIDGNMSTLIGASLVHKDKLYIGIFGDLSFFYDLNSLGNRNVGNNIRILLVNNGKGTEFRNYENPGAKFGELADKFIAAGGHNGNKSVKLVKHFAEDLGYDYLSASNKDEFLSVYERFLSLNISRSMIFEVFTNSDEESEALRIMRNLMDTTFTDVVKNSAKQLLGHGGIQAIKNLVK